MKKATKIIDLITILIFLLFIAVPLTLTNLKDDQVSAIDNSVLMNFKDIGKEGSLTEDIDTFISQRIGLRTELITAYVKGNDMLFNTLEHPTYTYGKDGYVYFHMSQEKLDKGYLKAFAKFIGRMQKYCKKHDVDFLYCINPDKTQVYQQYLPAGANLTFPRQNYLLEMLDKYEINYLDNTQLLIDASSSKDVFNRKFDAGHWNETGALLGISNILKTLSLNHPDILLNSPEDYTACYGANQFLPLSFLEINEPVTNYFRNTPQTVNVTAEDPDLIIDSTYNDYHHFINPSHPEYPKILVFRGSYFLDKEKFMNESFSESVFIHSYNNVFNLDYYIDRFNPDIVLFESVEYATINKYFSKELLTNTVWN